MSLQQTWTFTDADHDRADHFNPGNWHPTTCPKCARIHAANLARRDQHHAARRDDDNAGARAVGTALLIMAAFLTGVPGTWSLYLALTNLGEVRAWHVAWFPLLGITAYVIHRLWKNGQNR